MSKQNYSVCIQVALNLMVEIGAESFEEAVTKGREMVADHRSALHMAKRAHMKTERGITIQDTEAHLISVSNDDAGCMYK